MNKRYEYQEILISSFGTNVIEELNKHGQDGWKVIRIDYDTPSTGFALVMLERELCICV